MFKIIPQAKRLWIYGAAAAIIIGSSSTMVYALNNNIPADAATKAAFSAAATGDTAQTKVVAANINTVYHVIDLSKNPPDSERTEVLKAKLSLNKDLTPEQIEEKYQAVIAATIPGDKDISAEQAAAYAAAILAKAYGTDFTGYTAEASFSRNAVPNSDNWTVIFHTADGNKSAKRYLASINSVSGTMLNASCYDLAYSEENSPNVQDPAWEDKAVADIAKLLPENVAIVGSNVVGATPAGGVMVVSNLSDGSAFAVRLTGENKEAAAYQFFPNGYDGSWDFHPVTADGVG